MRKIKRILAGALCALLLFNLGIRVSAAPARPGDVETAINVAELRIRELRDADYSYSSGQSALFSEYGRLLQMAMYVDFIGNNDVPSTGQYGTARARVYAEQLYALCEDFTYKYSESSIVYTSVMLGVVDTPYSESSMSNYIADSMITAFSEYTYGVLDAMSRDVEATEEHEVLKRKYGTHLVALVSVLEHVIDDADNVIGLANSIGGTSVAGAFSAKANEILTNPNYATLVDIGMEFNRRDSTTSLFIDPTLTFIENLATVAFDEQGDLEVDANPSLSATYLAILSASAVYEPFVSYTGNDDFMRALQSLYDEEEAFDLKILYNTSKSFKKPLYKRELDDKGAPTGVATLITLNDFLKDIKSGVTGSLCTIYGEFKSVNDQWVYLQGRNDVVDEMAYETAKYLQTLSAEGGLNAADSVEGSKNAPSNKIAPSGDPSKPSISIRVNRYFANAMSSIFDRNVYAAIDDGFSEQDKELIGMSNSGSIYAYERVTNESAMSPPVLMYGAKYARAIDNLTTMILSNIMSSSRAMNSVTNKNGRYLYVNAFGDIVLANDLVVLPGAANPIIYANNEYNPFTAAFMNYYPSVIKNTSYFKVSGKTDIEKYLIFGNYDAGTNEHGDWKAAKIKSIDTIEPNAPLLMPNFVTDFTSNNGLDKLRVFKSRRLLFNSGAEWGDKEMCSFAPLLNSASITVNGYSVFPYVIREDLSGIVASAITQNLFTYFGMDTDTGEIKTTGKLNDAYLINVFLVAGLNGTNNTEAYEEKNLLSYDVFTEGAADRKFETLRRTSDSIYKNTTDVSGVIGIKSFYDNPVVGRVLMVFREHRLIFMFLVLLFILIKFSKSHFDLLQMVVWGLLAAFMAPYFLTTLPDLLPNVFNGVTNNISQNLTYEILALDAENYLVGGGIDDLDKDGYIDYKSTAITLYRAAGARGADLIDGLNVDAFDTVGGRTVSINRDAGVFVKGNEIKSGTNPLFNTIEITGDLDSSYAYTLNLKKTVSSNVDYYVPYYQIVSCFIDKLNSLSSIYSIPRKTMTYSNGATKNNYLVYSYVNSKPFVTPGEYDYVEVDDEMGWTPEELAAYKSEGDTIVSALDGTFGGNADWLGISNFLYNLSDTSKKTLWANTMHDLGYYYKDESGNDWVVNTEKMDDLVTYVNYQTKRFVFDMSSQIGYLSDDVMVKTIALRALIAFNQHASTFGHWMYPQSVSYADMSLKDVLRSVFVSDYNHYVNVGMDIIEYVDSKHGWFNLVVFDVLVVVMFLTANIINWVIPLSYLLLVVLIAIKCFTRTGIKNALKGYVKTIILVSICSTMMTGGVIVARSFNGNVIAIYFLLLLMLGILFFVSTVAISVVKNFSEFGNDELTVKGLANKFRFTGFSRNRLQRNKTVRTNDLVYSNRGRRHYRDSMNRHYDRYALDARMDDVYRTRGRRRTPYYGYTGYGNEYGRGGYGSDYRGEDYSPSGRGFNSSELQEVESLEEEQEEVTETLQ